MTDAHPKSSAVKAPRLAAGGGRLRVRLLFFASIAEVVGARERALDVAPGSTVADAFRAVIADHPALARHLPHVSYARNEEFVPGDTRLDDGDEVVFIPPVSGGA